MIERQPFGRTGHMSTCTIFGAAALSRVETTGKLGWSESWNAYDNERTWSVLDMLFAVAKETGKTPAQVALNWLLHRPGVTAPIIGVRKLEHLEDNLGATGWVLSEGQIDQLNRASEQILHYPYDIVDRA